MPSTAASEPLFYKKVMNTMNIIEKSLECPCCGKKFNLSTGDIIEISHVVSSQTIAQQDISKGVLIHRKIGDIKTVVENYESYETYACQNCSMLFWNIKRASKIISIIIILITLAIFPIIGITTDIPLLIVVSIFALIFLKSFYQYLFYASTKILTKICARDLNMEPELEHVLKCGTHPLQIEEQQTQKSPKTNAADDFSDLPF